MSAMFRPVAIRNVIRGAALRPLSTSSLRANKGPVDAIKDAAKKVDRTVSDAAVKGIDKGVAAKDSLKSSADATASEVKGKASELQGEAKGKAAELEGQAKGKAEEIKGKM